MAIFFGFGYCSIFICIWQLVSNYGLIRIESFVSRFLTQLYNQFCFSSTFSTPCICRKIRCDTLGENFWNQVSFTFFKLRTDKNSFSAKKNSARTLISKTKVAYIFIYASHISFILERKYERIRHRGYTTFGLPHIRFIRLFFFSRNSVFLSQQFSQNSVFQPKFCQPNEAVDIEGPRLRSPQCKLPQA